MYDYELFEKSIEKYFDTITGQYIGPEDYLIEIKNKATDLCKKYLNDGNFYYDVNQILSANNKTVRFLNEINDIKVVEKMIEDCVAYNPIDDNKNHSMKVDLHNKGQDYRPINFVYIYSKNLKPLIKDKLYLKLGFKDGRMIVCIHFSSYKN